MYLVLHANSVVALECLLAADHRCADHVAGESANDLSFFEGEELLVVQACSTLFWYVAENSRGHRGLVPMTYLEVGAGGVWR